MSTEAAPAPEATPSAAPAATPAATTSAAPAAAVPTAPSTEPSILTGDDASAPAGQANATTAAADIELKFPDGVVPNEQLVSQFKPLAKKLGLDSGKAQEVVDLYVGALAAESKKTADAWAEQQAKWASDVQSDKELGGAQFQATVADVRKVFSTFDKDGSIRKDIAALGIGNHPSLVRLAARVAKAISEDSVAGRTAAGPSAPSGEDVLQALYPSMFQQRQ